MTAQGAETGAFAPPVVVGDGTDARGRAGRRWRRLRPVLVVLGVLLAGGLLAALPSPRTSVTPLAPDNAARNGSRAVAQILERQGVTVTYVRTVADAEREAARGGTLLVASDLYLDETFAARIDAIDADLVLASATSWLDVLAPGLDAGFTGNGDVEPREARCDDEDATVAGTITAAGTLAISSGGWVGCFPREDGLFAFATGQDEDGRRVTVLADATPLTNGALAEQGNAALSLRMLGRHANLVWYVPSATDIGFAGGDGGASPTDLLPPWATVLGFQALIVALAAALWRGRRLGPVLAERLPVVVPAAETVRGRGRLYRRSRSYGHAAAALRAGTATRLATRLGLPRSADAPATIDAVARATGTPADEVARLLYGPPPADDAGLALLADELDILESEVHRS